MFGLVRSYAEGSETQRRPKVEAGQLPTFGNFHFVLPRARKGLTQALANLMERDFQRNRASRAVKYQTWHGPVIPVRAQSSYAIGSSARTDLDTACHNASLTALNDGL